MRTGRPKARILLLEEAVTETIGQCSEARARKCTSEERVAVLKFGGYGAFEGPEELSVTGIRRVVRGGGKDRGREGRVHSGVRGGDCRGQEESGR